jgi:integrase
MKGPAKSTQIKNGAYYQVRAEGKKRVWTYVSRVDEGLPVFFAQLGKLHAAARVPPDTMGQLVTDWEAEVMVHHAEKTKVDERARGREIARRLANLRAGEIQPADVLEFLAKYSGTSRTYNAYRAQLGELMRYAMLKGHRPPGTNPVTGIIPTKRISPRDRYITDSELRRIKVAALRWGDDQETRSGPMLCALIDMAYLTAQRFSDLLAIRWKRADAFENGRQVAAFIDDDGIHFKPSKTRKRTNAGVTIQWTPKLEDVVRRLKELRKQRRAFGSQVFTRQDGQPYTYWGASTAWLRARKRAGVEGCTFNDLRAKALTDKEAREGMSEARKMGTHTTESQTADYVRRKRSSTTAATK